MLYTDPAETHHTPAYTKQRRPKLTQRRPTQHSAGGNAYIYIYTHIDIATRVTLVLCLCVRQRAIAIFHTGARMRAGAL